MRHNDNFLLQAVWETAVYKPEQLAMKSAAERLSYGELWHASGVLAREIRLRNADCDPVMVLGHKTPAMIVAILACLRSGHAFVPIDTDLPAHRIAAIADQLDTPFCLAADAYAETLAAQVACKGVLSLEMPVLLSKDAPSEAAYEPWVAGEDVQYIIFTSGSTGKPKGIEISAACANNFLTWLRRLSRCVRRGSRIP